MHYYDLALCRALVEHGIQPVLLTCNETEASDDLPFDVQRVFVDIYGSSPSWQRGLRYARGLWWVLSRNPARDGRIVHLHYFHVPTLDWLFARALKLRGFKVVVTAHDVVPFDADPRDLRPLVGIYRLADRIIVHTATSRDELATALQIDRRKVSVVHQGPYPDFAVAAPRRGVDEARRLLGLETDGKAILFFGQIKQVKGLDTLIRAFAEVLRQHPDARLVIAGPVWKDDFDVYARLIDSLQLRDRVVARVGYIPDGQVPLYFQAADVVALPYRRVYQSAVLFMAHSFGRPVVATTVGGLAEVVQEGSTGFLVPPDDERFLAGAILKALDDPQKAERMGAAGKRWVEEHYSWRGIAGQVAQLYRGMVQQGGS